MKKFNKVIKYGVIIVIAIFLLKNAYKGFETREIWEGIKKSKFSWLILAICSNILSHIFRAARWKYLMNAINFHPKYYKTFLADLSGLFANIFLPRLGEIFRCTALKRMVNIPITPSLTTVIVERFMDVIIFILLVIFALVMLGSKMVTILDSLSFNNIIPSTKILVLISTLFVIFFIIMIFIRSKLKKLFKMGIDILKSSLKSSKEILLKGNKKMIILNTIFVWVFYYLSIYLVFFAIDSTSNLKIDAGIIILIASSLGLAAPIQGGVGAMHKLVVIGLSIYHINKLDSILSATLIHGVQFFTAFVIGGICMFLSFIFNKKDTI